MGRNANQRPNEMVLDFTALPEPWRTHTKTVAMARLNPTHEAVFHRGVFLPNRPVSVKTLRDLMSHIRYLVDWASLTGAPDDITEWNVETCLDYLTYVQATASEWRLRGAQTALQAFKDFGPLLTGGGLKTDFPRLWTPNFTGENRTPVIPPEVVWSLVRACWTYIDVFAPDLLTARQELEALDTTVSAAGRQGHGAFDAKLEHWLQDGNGYIPLHVINVGRGKKGEINWSGLASVLGSPISVFHSQVGKRRRRTVEEAIDAGFPTRCGTLTRRAATVTRSDGTTGPWCPGFELANVKREITNLRAAIYIFTAMMTMMRDSELQAIPAGSLGTRYGAPVIHSVVAKDAGPTGRPEAWWISEPVAQAIGVAEKIARTGERIFGSVRNGQERQLQGFDVVDEISRFVSWVNDHSPENGLEPIPDFHLAPHMFRRTMAVITANEPDGEIALGITLKHNATRALANSVTSGYAVPTPAWAREFKHQAQDVAAGELVAEWGQHRDGEHIARGPGANQYLAGLDDVSAKLQDNPIHVGDDRMLRDLLRDEFSTIELGPLNHCLGVTKDAACLKNLGDDAKNSGPLRSLCSPTSCKNSVVTDQHMPVWIAEEEDLMKRLKDRRMAPAHRERLETELARVRTITTQDPK
jgi:hypothetical protein